MCVSAVLSVTSFLPVVPQWSSEEGSLRPRPVELWWEAALTLAGTGDAERGEGGPVWAGTAAPAAGGVPGRPPLLPQLPSGTDPRAELHLSAQLPPSGESDGNSHPKIFLFTFLECKIFTVFSVCTSADTFASFHLSVIITQRTHLTLLCLTPMSALTAQSIMSLRVDTGSRLSSHQDWRCTFC